MSNARRFIVKGRVQGVFFRESTRRVAQELGITGHAINLSNGDVEVVAQGTLPALEKLEHWLQGGPTMAVVTSVAVETIESGKSERFVTG